MLRPEFARPAFLVLAIIALVYGLSVPSAFAAQVTAGPINDKTWIAGAQSSVPIVLPERFTRAIWRDTYRPHVDLKRISKGAGAFGLTAGEAGVPEFFGNAEAASALASSCKAIALLAFDPRGPPTTI